MCTMVIKPKSSCVYHLHTRVHVPLMQMKNNAEHLNMTQHKANVKHPVASTNALILCFNVPVFKMLF